MKRNNPKDTTVLNENIRAREVRCIGDDGTQYDVIPTSDALDIAQREGLDLVLVSADANPPVCKIMDYGKYKYQLEKKKKEAKKKQKKIDIKEIKFSVKIAQNDIDFKVKHSREFLLAGKHVKMRVFLRGREMANPRAGIDVLEKIWPLVEDIGDRIGFPKQDGRFINMMVTPKK